MIITDTARGSSIDALVDAAMAAGRGGNLDDAISSLNAAWDLIPEPRRDGPDVDRVLQNLAGAWRLKGDLDKALELYRAAAATPLGYRSSTVHLWLGRILFDRGETVPAREHLRRAWELSEGRAFEDAPQIYVDAATRDPEIMDELPDDLYEEISQLSELGNELVDHGRHDEAAHMFQQALRLLPVPRERWEAGTWLVVAIGDCRFAQGRFAEALTQFRIAEAYPGGGDNALVLLRIGECLVELDGDKHAAMDVLTRAQALAGGAIFAHEDAKYLGFFLRHAPAE
jgi:tetratricopeptide (TPR) repeat protein